MLNYTPEDGYTEPGFIRAEEGLHDELRFAFRPVLVEQQAPLVASLETMKPVEKVRKIAQVIAEQVKEWSLTDTDGDPVPVTEQTTRRLKFSIFYRLWGIVLGTEPTDIDPLWSEQQTDEEQAFQLQAAESQTPVGQVKEGAHRKNSNGG